MKFCLTLRTALLAGLAAAFLGTGLPAQASITIANTRVIYNAPDKEVTVRLNNSGTTPALVQSWLDKGDPTASPSAIELPFVITPPVARVDPGKGQTLRILHTGGALPQDRESVFYLNVLEIPPKAADADGANKLQLAFRSRIKFFFRPQGLVGTALEAPAKLSWKRVQNGTQTLLEITNPTAYHVSLALIEVTSGARFDDGVMVGPGQTLRVALKGAASSAAGSTVHYRAISDYGGSIEGTAPLP
ncbi:fimbria/pilus periplasmic chaperone [Pseudomonas nicosulfuronedens]